MRGLVVFPGQAGRAELRDLHDPRASEGAVLLETLDVGICGTDREILAGGYGTAPEGSDALVLGHEALARVVSGSEGLAPGDLVVPMVRWPDPLPCPSCAAGEWDMCRNGLFTEHGIRGRDGFARERLRLDPHRLVRVPAGLRDLAVLVEPASIAAKAWEHVEAVARRARWQPRRAVVTGAGPVGLLAALIGVHRGLEVTVLDRVTSGPKPGIAEALGARYATGELPTDADVILECTGAPGLVAQALGGTARNGIVCLAGLAPGRREIQLDLGTLERTLVLENDVVIGVVNANRRHYQAAVLELTTADAGWLRSLVTRRVPLDRWREALERRDEDVKVVLQIAA